MNGQPMRVRSPLRCGPFEAIPSGTWVLVVLREVVGKQDTVLIAEVVAHPQKKRAQ